MPVLEIAIADARRMFEHWVPLPQGEAHLSEHGCQAVIGWHLHNGWLVFALNDERRAAELHQPIAKQIFQGLSGEHCRKCGKGPLMFSCRQIGTGLCHPCGHALLAETLAALKQCERYMTEKGVSHEYPVMIDARKAIANADPE